jgi:protocatechuate 3,4-dioxygenase beta subunit
MFVKEAADFVLLERIPLKGARIDIWHANPQGIYSAVKDQGTTGRSSFEDIK